MKSKDFNDGVEYGVEAILNLPPKRWAEERESVAAAICTAIGADPYSTVPPLPGQTMRLAWNLFIPHAEAALKALGFQEYPDDV